MLEIKRMKISEFSFIGILIYLPKITLRIIYSSKLIIFDECFNINFIESKCKIPLIQTSGNTFNEMLDNNIGYKSPNLDYINEFIKTKEAIVMICEK